ncbi:MAG: MBL fold metallo-hydrolase [Bifidobacteriaceae bacterium]|jgi:glyoxylase-like metal-dependent hydrolase (beta-lactamase superfamily II)|nr:MBL fold metallo-hydrolase [Bifidobacteriaceae bacterium]
MSIPVPRITTTHLVDGVWAIAEGGLVQCFLIEGATSAVLADCGLNGRRAIRQAVDAVTAKPVQLVFTHTDNDHTGAAEFFSTPLAHPAEFDYYAARRQASLPVAPIWEGDTLDLGGTKLEVILIPGHTPGHIALLDRAARRLFIGDTVSDAQVFMFGPGRNLTAYIASLRKLESLTSLFDTLCCAHGSSMLQARWVSRTLTAAEMLAAGQLEGHPPPRDLPCQVYSHNGVNLLYP